MELGLVDAHCHFDFPVFERRRTSLLAQARAAGITDIVIPGVRRCDWPRVQAAAEHPGVHYCLGIHPWFVAEHKSADLDALKDALSSRPPGCVALGECGLDRLHGTLAEQQRWFDSQVEIARDVDVPLVIHSVRTHDEVAAVLRRKQFSGRVLVHGFSGSEQQARKLIELGCFIGVGGVITHDRATKTRGAIARLPLSALVIETDAPDMAPAGVAQGANSPLNLPLVLQALAALRTESIEVLAQALRANVKTLYRWA